MQYDDRNLHVEIHPKQCSIPADELARMQRALEPVRDAVGDVPRAELFLDVIHQAEKAYYHVEAKLRLPGKTLFADDKDIYLDSAYQRCVQKLTQEAQAYRPDAEAVGRMEDRQALDTDVVAPEDADAGPLGRAVTDGNYRAFRTGMTGYEDWLRKRVGRWIKRIPEAQAQVGRAVKIGDAVENVYLAAFEGFTRRPTDIRLSEWLDKLIDPAIREMLRHPAEASENASLARTVRQGG